jgi:hypothetical protein
MRSALLAGCAAVLLTFSGAAIAQQTTPPASQTPPAKDAPAAPADATPAKPSETGPATPPKAASPDAAPGQARKASRRRACRDEARQKGLRGDEASGHILICVAEARLECTKQAVAQATDRRSRNAMIRECLGQGEPRRPRRGGR